MKILAVGDVSGKIGIQYLKKRLSRIKQENKIDFVIVNGENASGIGIIPQQADEIFSTGADVITLGNHVWDKKQIIPYIEDNKYILRPANLAPQLPGEGYGVYDVLGYRLLVINLIGRCEMNFGPDNPFLAVDKILSQMKNKYDIAVCEMHAAATSEKLAMGYYLDSRVSAVYGTHTHVQTADERINPKGTGYITDIGMTGALWSVLGINVEQSISFFRGDITEHFKTADGQCAMGGVIFDIDVKTKKCLSVKRIFDIQN